MSKIGNHRFGFQESNDYQFGWDSAERGEPRPDWEKPYPQDVTRLDIQRCGWDDYHAEQVSP